MWKSSFVVCVTQSVLYTSFYSSYNHISYFKGLMYLNQALTPPVVSFDPEGLIFAVGMDSQHVRLYDLRSFDKAF